MLKRIFSIIFVILWLFVIYSFSDTVGITSGIQTRTILEKIVTKVSNFLYNVKLSNQELSEAEIQDFVSDNYLLFRKLCHFFVYFMLGIFSYLSIIVIFDKGIWFSMLMTVGFSTIYSIFDEIHQSAVPGRYGAVTDCLIDISGAAVASILISLILHYRKRRRGDY